MKKLSISNLFLLVVVFSSINLSSVREKSMSVNSSKWIEDLHEAWVIRGEAKGQLGKMLHAFYQKYKNEFPNKLTKEDTDFYEERLGEITETLNVILFNDDDDDPDFFNVLPPDVWNRYNTQYIRLDREDVPEVEILAVVERLIKIYDTGKFFNKKEDGPVVEKVADLQSILKNIRTAFKEDEFRLLARKQDPPLFMVNLSDNRKTDSISSKESSASLDYNNSNSELKKLAEKYVRDVSGASGISKKEGRMAIEAVKNAVERLTSDSGN
jgi:hypothetical protein